MRFTVATLFPTLIEAFRNEALLGRAKRRIAGSQTRTQVQQLIT